MVPAIVDGKKTGTATSDFGNLKKATLVASEVGAFVADGNWLRGPSGAAASGGANTSTPTEFAEWGVDDPYTLGASPSRADTTVTAAIRYDDGASDGLHAISKLVMQDMEIDAEIAVITNQTVTGLNAAIRRVEIGTVTAVGGISDDNPSNLTFSYRVSSRKFVKSA